MKKSTILLSIFVLTVPQISCAKEKTKGGWSEALISEMTEGCITAILDPAKEDFAEAARKAGNDNAKFPEQAEKDTQKMCACIIQKAANTWEYGEFTKSWQARSQQIIMEALQGGGCKPEGLLGSALAGAKNRTQPPASARHGQRHGGQSIDPSFAAKLKEVQKKYLDANPLLTATGKSGSKQKYQRLVTKKVKKYFKHVAMLYSDFPRYRDPETIIKSKRSLPKSPVVENNMPIWEEMYNLTRIIYDSLKNGKYHVVATDREETMRFDVHKVEKERGMLRWTVVIWSNSSPIGFEHDGWTIRFKKAPGESKPFAEASSNEPLPVLPIFEGSEYILDFPPGVQLNYYYTPMVHPDAKSVEIEFGMKQKGAASDRRVAFIFNLPVLKNWKSSWNIPQ
jgi:hypothetical protein